MAFSEELLINLLGNRSRLKILLALWRSQEELTIYKICKVTGLNRAVVKRHIELLVDGGLAKRKVYGEVSLFSLNSNGVMGKTLKEFFDETLR